MHMLPSASGLLKLRTPPLGWSSWNAFYCNVDEPSVRANAELLDTLGLRDAGYSFVNIDDCWMNETRGADGRLRVADKFPSGMPKLAADLHAMGLKLGLYTSQTSKTCMGRAAAYGHEAIDTETYCEWGVDYLKIDLCGGDQYSMLNTSWSKFRSAFDKCAQRRGGGDDEGMVMSVEYCGPDHPGKGSTDPVTGCGAYVGDYADLWRTSSDLQPMWPSMYQTAASNDAMATVARPGKVNDPDMLQVGNFMFQEGNMDKVEMKTHFGLWVVMGAPLILGKDLSDFDDRTMSQSEFVAIVGNREMIAVDQDTRQAQGTNKTTSEQAHAGGYEVWTKALGDGGTAVFLFNNGAKGRGVAVDAVVSWAQAGLEDGARATVRDVSDQRDVPGTFIGSYTARGLAFHDSVMIKLKLRPSSSLSSSSNIIS
eukprot:g3689.t1